MKQSLFKKFMDKVVSADEKDVIWCAGFYFVDLTANQAEKLRIATLEKWGVGDGAVRFPNGIGITPIKK